RVYQMPHQVEALWPGAPYRGARDRESLAIGCARHSFTHSKGARGDLRRFVLPGEELFARQPTTD
ncbi:MAG TPA: hypothetical protein VGL91_05060, partial [Acidobacteriota bacterium]